MRDDLPGPVRRVVVLTGAGISAESGVPTFRDADGLWEGHRVEDVATPHAFRVQPDVVHGFYDDRRTALATVEPNAAHLALAELERRPDVDLLVVTQNVDDLHERAGTRAVHHLHGQLRSARCLACRTTSPWDGDLAPRPPCPVCGARRLRPDIVWFGEVPFGMAEVADAVADADLFCSIGTSGAVYPAAGLVAHARARGVRTLELNLVPSDGAHLFDECRYGPASRIVPEWVSEFDGPAPSA